MINPDRRTVVQVATASRGETIRGHFRSIQAGWRRQFDNFLSWLAADVENVRLVVNIAVGAVGFVFLAVLVNHISETAGALVAQPIAIAIIAAVFAAVVPRLFTRLAIVVGMSVAMISLAPAIAGIVPGLNEYARVPLAPSAPLHPFYGGLVLAGAGALLELVLRRQRIVLRTLPPPVGARHDSTPRAARASQGPSPSGGRGTNQVGQAPAPALPQSPPFE